MSTKTELRYTEGSVELRSESESDGQKLGGYALKYNKRSRDLGGFVEQIAPGAVTKTLKDGADVLARYQHEDRFLLGRTSAETLRLEDGSTGLEYEVDLPGTSYANDLASLASRGDVKHSSFAFHTVNDAWTRGKDNEPIVRTLLEIRLIDVAPVVNPAYWDTSSGLRSLAEHLHLDADELADAISKDQVREMLNAPPTVIDLSSSSARSEDSPAAEPGQSHSVSRVVQYRADLLAKQLI